MMRNDKAFAARLLTPSDKEGLPRDQTFQDFMEAFGEAYNTGKDFPGFLSDPFGVQELRTIPRQLPQLGVSMLIFTIGMYLNCLSQAFLQANMAGWYQERWQPIPPERRSVVLWDVGHHMLPYLDTERRPWLSPDAFAIAVWVFVGFRFIILPGPMSMRIIIMRRLLTLLGVLYFFRGFCILSTVLPNPDSKCAPEISYPGEYIMEAFAIFFHQDMTCQDVLFSGHTVAITIATLCIGEYSPKSPWTIYALKSQSECNSVAFLVKLLCRIYMYAGFFVIIASRFHYTCDVFLGALLSAFTWWGYHYAIRMAPLADSWCHARFLLWLEKDSLDMKVFRRVGERRLVAQREADLRVAEEILREGQLQASVMLAGEVGSFVCREAAASEVTD